MMQLHDQGLVFGDIALSHYHQQEKRTRRYAIGFAGIFFFVLLVTCALWSSERFEQPRSNNSHEALFDRRLNICQTIFHHGAKPTAAPTFAPTRAPTPAPTRSPTRAPTASPVAPPGLIGTIVSGQTNRVTSQYQTTKRYPQSGETRFQGNVCGAIQAVLAHPTDPDVCFAGSVNGGVWRTRNCRADFPDWKPLTDDQPSSSVADMKFDETDPNKMLVAIGKRSSYANLGGVPVGLLLSNNILADVPTWTLLNNAAGTINFSTTAIEFSEV